MVHKAVVAKIKYRAVLQDVKKQRRALLGAVHEHLKKYISRLPAFVVSTKIICHHAILIAAVLYGSVTNRGSHRSPKPIGVWFTGRHRD